MYRYIAALLLLFPCLLEAQDINRYMVFFKDKEQTTYSVEKPHEFLSPRAIERRERQQIPVTVQDLPVSRQYVKNVEATGATVFYGSRWFNAVLVEAFQDQLSAMEALPEVEDVLFIAPGSKLLKSGKDSGSRKKSSKLRTSTVPENFQNSILGVPEMQLEGFSGQGKLIAVLDGGFKAVDQLPYFSHLFAGGRLVGQHDFTTATPEVFRYSSHGTKALSTISAVDSTTFIGIAPGADILLAVTEDVSSEYVVEEYNWLLGVEWADSAGADVISSSLGYSTFDDPAMNYTYVDLDGNTTVSARAATMASERGMVVVVSAGNSGNDGWKYIVTPADADGIISVGAIQEDGEIALFSSRGPSSDKRVKPEVVALGHRTIVADMAGGFTIGSGTSFAAPQIAGFVASAWGAYPELSSQALRELILNSGDRALQPDSVYGWGVPFFPRIKASVLHNKELEVAEKVKIYPNPVQEGQVYIEFEDPTGTEVFVNLFSATGQQLLNQQQLKQLGGSGTTYALDINTLTKGVFFIQIIRNDKAYSRKILKY